MLYYFFQTYFIYILCAFITVNYAIAQEHAAGEADPLTDSEGRGKCTAENCTCFDVPQWNGVDCYHVYISPFPRLDFRRFKYLPERMFLGLRIYDVWLWDSDVTVAENVLEGILGLDAFVAEKSSIEAVPDLRIVKDSLKSVAITSSRLTSLEGEHLQNLTSVRFLLFYNNFIRFIDPDAFWENNSSTLLSLFSIMMHRCSTKNSSFECRQEPCLDAYDAIIPNYGKGKGKKAGEDVHLLTEPEGSVCIMKEFDVLFKTSCY